MFKDSADKVQELFDEASGIMGMIAEVKMRCLLFKQKARAEKASWNEGPSDALQLEVDEAVTRMTHDLATYRSRLNEIYEELTEYGVFSEVEETEGDIWSSLE